MSTKALAPPDGTRRKVTSRRILRGFGMSILAAAAITAVPSAASASPVFNANPNPVQFGNVQVGTTKDLEVTVTNNGFTNPSGNSDATEVYLSPGAQSNAQFTAFDSTCGKSSVRRTLPGGTACKMTLRFTPTGGAASGTYVFTMHYTYGSTLFGDQTTTSDVTLQLNGVGTVNAPPPVDLTCGGLPATTVGTAGNDTLTGTKKRDVIVGLAGDDVITGLKGNDILCGGEGNDVLISGKGNDLLSGGAGTDSCNGGGGKDRVIEGCEVQRKIP